MARRKLTRFCSCSAIDWATSFASSSGRLISLMLMCTFLPVIECSSLRSASTSTPDLPITIPGRAVKMSTVIRCLSLRIRMSDRPAWPSLPLMWSRIWMSSRMYFGNSFFPTYQLDFQSWMTPTRRPPGCTFWPIRPPPPSSSRAVSRARFGFSAVSAGAGASVVVGAAARGVRVVSTFGFWASSIVMWQVRLKIRLTRPRARGFQRLSVGPSSA